MTWFLANWKEIAVGLIVIGILYLGYHIHTLTDYASENAILKVQNAKITALAPKLIKDTNTIQKVIIHEKPTDCGNSKPVSGIISSLR